MSVTWLKKATKTPESNTSEARRVVEEMLTTIKAEGEEAVRRYAHTLDKWSGEIVLTPEQIAAQIREVPADVRRDIDYAIEQVYTFACAQRESVKDIEVTLPSGLIAGQKVLPVNTVGCYARQGAMPTSPRPIWGWRLPGPPE